VIERAVLEEEHHDVVEGRPRSPGRFRRRRGAPGGERGQQEERERATADHRSTQT